MRVLQATMVFLVGLVGSVIGCSDRANLQCAQDANCDLATGGVCSDPGTGNQWCAYPDQNCSTGYRYSDLEVGDNVAGACIQSPLRGDDGASPPAAQFASCQGLTSTCRGESCCASPVVPHGTFYRGYDVAGDDNSSTATNAATISDFSLDKYEVTVGRFRKFVEAGMGTQSSPPSAGTGAHTNLQASGWQPSWNVSLATDTISLKAALKCDAANYNTWSDTPGLLENRPINCVTWYEAMAFCIWDGGYLPTEAEWNYTAAGGDEQRAYPWSSPASSLVVDSTHATFYDGSSCGGTNPTSCPGVVDVGVTPGGDGKFGQTDLAGNVGEPILDVLPGVGDAIYANPCDDCALVKNGDDYHVERGGSARELKLFMRTAHRSFVAPRDRSRDVGIRCARPPVK